MRKIIFTCLFICYVGIHWATSQSVKVITYNIRYENTWDGENAWSVRKARVSDMLHFYDADVIGLQEVLLTQLAYLDSSLSEYHHVGIGRDDGLT